MMINARNGFNELSCLVMLWMVPHHSSKGSRFSFHSYHHKAEVFLWDLNKSVISLISWEEVIQEDPLSMFCMTLCFHPWQNTFMLSPLLSFNPGMLTTLPSWDCMRTKCLMTLKAAISWFRYFPEPKKVNSHLLACWGSGCSSSICSDGTLCLFLMQSKIYWWVCWSKKAFVWIDWTSDAGMGRGSVHYGHLKPQ